MMINLTQEVAQEVLELSGESAYFEISPVDRENDGYFIYFYGTEEEFPYMIEDDGEQYSFKTIDEALEASYFEEDAELEYELVTIFDCASVHG